MGELQAIEKLLKKVIPVIGGAPWSVSEQAAAPKPPQGGRGGRPGGKPGQSSGGQRPQAQGKPGQRPTGPAVAKPVRTASKTGGVQSPARQKSR
jgi:ATP-dependent RNA helicase RhlE